MNKVVYNNLGANSGNRNIYIRSTDIEQVNWYSLLWSFPDEALYFMTKGNKIVIVDKCNKKKGKVERIFCPVMTDILRWLQGKPPKNKILQDHTKLAIKVLRTSGSLRTKYKFFVPKLKSTLVVGRTIYCKREPSVWANHR